MVNNKIVSRHRGPLPDVGKGESRKIVAGPLYPAAEVRAIAEKEELSLLLWTKKSIKDAQKYEFELTFINELVIYAVQNGRYRGSEWCQQKANGPWAACDVYSIKRREWVSHASTEVEFEYYLKFAISMTGKVLLIVSCHPPEERS